MITVANEIVQAYRPSGHKNSVFPILLSFGQVFRDEFDNIEKNIDTLAGRFCINAP